MIIKILLLDDEREILNSLKRLLKLDERFDVYATTDPEKALNLLKKENIQIVLSDIVMPEMNGIEFLQRAKEINGLVQVIMMSAYSSVDRVLECLERGAIDYVMKPFSEEELMSTLDNVISRINRWRRLVVAAREVTMGDREGCSDSVDTSDTGSNLEGEDSSPLTLMEKRLNDLKGRYGDNNSEISIRLIEWIEQEDDQMMKERLVFELGECLRKGVDEHILERALISRDAFLRNSVISFSKNIEEGIVPVLMPLMSSEDKDVRKLVLDIASNMSSELAEDIFLSCLDDEDVNIRSTAVEYLGAHKAKKAVDKMEEMLFKEDELMLISTLFETLSEIGKSHRYREIIDRFKESIDPILVHSFLKYLGAFGEREDFEWLFKALETDKIYYSREVTDCIQNGLKRIKGLNVPDFIKERLINEVENALNPLGAYQALVTLYMIDATRALELARKVIDDGDTDRIIAVAQFLAEFGEDADREKLNDIAEETDNEDLSSLIFTALDSCKL